MLDPHTDIRSTPEKPFHHHANAITIRNALRKLGFDWNEFHSFTTIRNPWERAVSFWSYADANPDSIWHRRKREHPRFDDFVASIPKGTPIIRFGGQRNQLLVKEIIRLEDLDTEYPKLASTLGITIPEPESGALKTTKANRPTLTHINASSHSDYREYYSPRSRAHIEDLFRSDIELGEYRFDR